MKFITNITSSIKTINDSFWLAVGKVRRIYLLYCRKNYVRRHLSLRRGECNQCAACCSLLFPCAAQTEDKLCSRYDGRRWAVCKVFPIDRRDIRDVERSGGRCGYYFVSG